MIRLAQVRKGLRALTHQLWRRALAHRVLAATEHRRVLAPLTVKTVFDVGANRGQFALLCRVLFPTAPIHAFEPLAAPASTLRSLFQDDPMVTVHQVAIDTAVGLRTMHVSARDDSSSLLRAGPGQLQHFPATREVGEEDVEVCRLADCVDLASTATPALLKIDVQGNEVATLHACVDVLSAVEYVYVEASFEELYVGQPLASEVIGLLAGLGFQLRSIENTWRGPSGWAVQADLLFRRAPTANGTT